MKKNTKARKARESIRQLGKGRKKAARRYAAGAGAQYGDACHGLGRWRP